MEKLQQALEKARAARQGASSAPSAAAPVSLASSQKAWDALKPATPNLTLLTRNRVVAHKNSQEATPFDILRTKIVLQMRRHGWRRLAITSPTQACGKSTTAANLAFGLSRQPDTYAVLLEIDLRNPGLQKIFGFAPARNISRVLTDEIPFSDQALRLGDNVALGLAKGPTQDPTRVLFSRQSETAIARIEEEYVPDLMIFDTAPVLVSDDTRAFLGQVDCALIIACAERTTIAQIDNCEREIAEQTNVLGVVLNQSKFSGGITDYEYGYGAS